MGEVMLALARTMANLRSGKVWLYVLTPALAALVLMIVLATTVLGWAVQQLLTLPPMSWLVGWGLAWLAQLLAYLGGWMAIFALAYLCASLLAAIVIMPLMLKHLAGGEYRDVAAMGKDSFVAAALNSVGASFSSLSAAPRSLVSRSRKSFSRLPNSASSLICAALARLASRSTRSLFT